MRYQGTVASMDLHAFSHLRFFEGAELASAADLLLECEQRVLARDELLIAPGESHHRLFLIITGHLRVHVESLDSVPAALLGPGESIGEFSIIDQQPASTFVVAAEPCHLLVVEERVFWSLVDQVPGVAHNLLTSLTQRLRRNNTAITDSIRLPKEYRRQGETDEQTGLHNRRWLNEMLSREIRRTVCDQRPLTVLMVSIDDFERFHDTHGKMVGDRALTGIARILAKHVRPCDLLARFEGDEFVVVLPNTELARAQRVAERLSEAVRAMDAGDPTTHPVTVSIGLAQLHRAQSMDNLIAATQGALFRAQQAGGNRVAI